MVRSPTGPPGVSQDASSLEVADASPLAANLVGGAADASAALDDRVRRAGGGYSRFVVWTKLVLPFFALALIALVIAWPRLNSDNTFRIGFASMNLSGEAGPGMDNARYVGTDENRQPYSVTADLARIISETTGQVDLELPKADLTLEDGTWLVLTADTGRYTRTPPALELEGGVNLFHDTGYEIATEQLSVNLKAGTAEGHVPVNGHGPFGELKAQGLKLIDKGQVIHFTGPAQLILYAAQSDN